MPVTMERESSTRQQRQGYEQREQQEELRLLRQAVVDLFAAQSKVALREDQRAALREDKQPLHLAKVIPKEDMMPAYINLARPLDVDASERPPAVAAGMRRPCEGKSLAHQGLAAAQTLRLRGEGAAANPLAVAAPMPWPWAAEAATRPVAAAAPMARPCDAEAAAAAARVAMLAAQLVRRGSGEAAACPAAVAARTAPLGAPPGLADAVAQRPPVRPMPGLADVVARRSPVGPPPGLADVVPEGAPKWGLAHMHAHDLWTPPAGRQAAPAGAPCAGAPAPTPVEPLEKSMTTVVVQNLSGRYSQEDILKLWPVDGTYDFLHIPYNLLQKRPLGYIFINFATHALAAAFQREWHGKMLRDGSNKKPLEVRPAEVQGKQANLELIKTRKVGQLDKVGFPPVVLEGKVRLTSQAISALLSRLRSAKTLTLCAAMLKEAASFVGDVGPDSPTTAAAASSSSSEHTWQCESP